MKAANRKRGLQVSGKKGASRHCHQGPDREPPPRWELVSVAPPNFALVRRVRPSTLRNNGHELPRDGLCRVSRRLNCLAGSR